MEVGFLCNLLGVYFSSIDHAKKYYKFTLQCNQLNSTVLDGSDTRLIATSNFPAPGIRQIQAQTMIDQAILRKSNPTLYSNATITQGLRAFPQIYSTATKFQFGGIIGGILYPFGVSFLLPSFVISLVKEKEERILIMMKMNGINELSYYASHYTTFFTQFVFSTFFFFIFGMIPALNLTFFTATQVVVYLLLFFVWGQ